MMAVAPHNRLDRPVDERYDHALGAVDAEFTLVEYGSYACPSCRAFHEQVAEIRDRFGDEMRYVFRHRPVPGNALARRAAELVELCPDPALFWKAHVELMTRSDTLTEEDLHAVAAEYGLGVPAASAHPAAVLRAKARVDADMESARISGVRITPTFFINGRRYDGPWDKSALSEAMLGSLGHRIQAAALDFAKWAPSTGILLLLASVLAVILVNSPLGPRFTAFWEQPLGLGFADASFALPLRLWVNDGLLALFFLVVGLEIKRELTVGHLEDRQAAMLPVAAAIGGLAMPALLYAWLVPAGPWSHGWGVPMSTDTAFAVALIAMMGTRVPVALRVFLTAAAIVDDIGAIIVVAIFYSARVHPAYLGAAAAVVGMLWLLNWWSVYRATPYLLLGAVLWWCVHASGLHATLAGVILALFIPTRPPPNLRALRAQADTILAAEARREMEVLRHGPSIPSLEAFDAIHDRLESPADRMLRRMAPRSSYLVIPLFALVNAGVVMSAGVISGHESLMTGIIVALVIGKPLGFVAASVLVVASGLAKSPQAYSWRQLAGAGALAGIGFTMSLFIAGQAFPVESDFAAAKIAIFAGSMLSAVIGVAILWSAGETGKEDADTLPPPLRLASSAEQPAGKGR